MKSKRFCQNSKVLVKLQRGFPALSSTHKVTISASALLLKNCLKLGIHAAAVQGAVDSQLPGMHFLPGGNEGLGGSEEEQSPGQPEPVWGLAASTDPAAGTHMVRVSEQHSQTWSSLLPHRRRVPRHAGAAARGRGWGGQWVLW